MVDIKRPQARKLATPASIKKAPKPKKLKTPAATKKKKNDSRLAQAKTKYTTAGDPAPVTHDSGSLSTPKPSRKRLTLGRKTGSKKATKTLKKPATTGGTKSSSLTPVELKKVDAEFGKTRTYKTVNDLFYARHPKMKGKLIKKGQKALAKEWLKLRSDVESRAIDRSITQVKTDSIAVKTDSIAVKTDSIAVKTDSIAVKTDSIAVKTDSIAVKTDSIAVKTDSIAVKTDSIAVKTDSIAVKTDSIAVKTDSIAKGITDKVFYARHPNLKGKKLSKRQQAERNTIKKRVEQRLQPLKKFQESAAYKALDPKGQAAATGLMRANYLDPKARARVEGLLGSLGSVKNAAAKTQILEAVAAKPPLNAEKLDKTKKLFTSPRFAALSAANQVRITEAIKLSKLDIGLLVNTTKLIGDPKFQSLNAQEKTAVLSQVKNYPNAKSVENLQKLLQKDWFTSFSLADKQRSVKMVAFLSQHSAGDQTVINNTLDKFLAPGAPYSFDWNRAGSAYGSASGTNFHFNRRYLPAGNNKVDTSNGDTLHMVTHTVAHEVNHLVNNDRVSSSYRYFMAEYRAFYVGFKAENGRAPTRNEVIDRVQYLLTSTSGAYDYIRRALADGTEGPKIVAFMKKVLGRNNVTQANAGSLGVTHGNRAAPAPEKVDNTDPNNTNNS